MWQKLILSVLTAAIVTLGGWVLMVDRAVAAQDARNEAVLQRLDAMHEDIREMRQMMVEFLWENKDRK